VAGRLQTPAHLSRRALREILYPKHDPKLREATPETVGSLTLADVKAYYAKIFRPDMTTIVVVGRVSPDQALAVIERSFGAWKAVGPKPETDPPPVPMNPAASTVVPDTSRVQDEVSLAQTLGLTRFHPDYYPLQVGNRILSGAAFASRLFRDLREQSGLVYSVDALLDVGKTRSVFAVFYACDPPNVSKARALVERNLRAMQTRRVTAAELLRAKTLLIRGLSLAAASVDGIGGGFLDLAQKDLPLDESVRAARRYLRVTAAQVQAAFAKWIRPDGLAQVTTGPAPG
jgi:zinc protease